VRALVVSSVNIIISELLSSLFSYYYYYLVFIRQRNLSVVLRAWVCALDSAAMCGTTITSVLVVVY